MIPRMLSFSFANSSLDMSGSTARPHRRTRFYVSVSECPSGYNVVIFDTICPSVYQIVSLQTEFPSFLYDMISVWLTPFRPKLSRWHMLNDIAVMVLIRHRNSERKRNHLSVFTELDKLRISVSLHHFRSNARNGISSSSLSRWMFSAAFLHMASKFILSALTGISMFVCMANSCFLSLNIFVKCEL